MTKEGRFLEMLVHSLNLMAAEPSAQVSALPSFVCVPDEIALLFDDCYHLVDQIVAAGLMTTGQRDQFKEIDLLLSRMNSGPKDVWEKEALETAPDWQTLRMIARKLLENMGRKPGPPDLSWVTYVEGESEDRKGPGTPRVNKGVNMKPEFPIRLTWTETGEIETYENEEDILCNLEDFDSDEDGHEATVRDACGRPVRLKVKIWKNLVQLQLQSRADGAH